MEPDETEIGLRIDERCREGEILHLSNVCEDCSNQRGHAADPTVLRRLEQVQSCRFRPRSFATRNSTGTRMLNLVERLAEQDGWLQEHKIVSPKEVSRMGDIQFVSELLLGIEKGIQDRHASVDLFFAEFDDSKFPVEMMRTWATDFSTTKDLVLRILGNQLTEEHTGITEQISIRCSSLSIF